MDVNAINAVNTTAVKRTETAKAKTKTEEAKESKTQEGFSDKAAVYEKTDEKKVTEKRDNKAIVAQLKADAEATKQQLIDIVRKSIGGQADAAFAAETGLKSLFENLTLDADTIAKAKADIAEDGYWGVNQTSDRILDFAKALSGGDPDKADELLEAFKKGFNQATKAWGDKLPDICQDTYKAVEEKFAAWKQEKTEE